MLRPVRTRCVPQGRKIGVQRARLLVRATSLVGSPDLLVSR